MENTEQFKTTLTEEKVRLEGELGTVARRNPLNENDWEPIPQEVGQESDPNDRADVMEHFGENAAITQDLEIRLREVDAALERIEKGTYGVCVVSGCEIEHARLEADPTAATCIVHMNDEVK